ncbi:hypothetical protein, partial [uncultured Lamprocystis sp.]|uniref:hypothetical protein n=1 Tax=uncultured Lamprocystis sp. TaxID=543132 RepID=UPI0025D0E37D
TAGLPLPPPPQEPPALVQPTRAQRPASGKNGQSRDELLKQNIRHEIRERIWIARIYAANCWPTLFICGANHAMNVQTLLCQTGCRSTILAMDYDPPQIKEQDSTPSDLNRKSKKRWIRHWIKGISIQNTHPVSREKSS